MHSRLVLITVVTLFTLAAAQGDIDLNCIIEKAQNDASLQQCIPADMNDFSSICSGDCLNKAVGLYRDCNADAFADIFCQGCARDQNNSLCVNVLNSINDPNSQVMQDLQAACGSTSGCTGQCREAVDNIGCCFGNAVNIVEKLGISGDTLSMLQQCDVEPCDAPCSGTKATVFISVIIAAVAMALAGLF